MTEDGKVKLVYPEDVKHNVGYWLSIGKGLASRRKFLRWDNSTSWRESYHGVMLARHPNRSVPFSELVGPAKVGGSFRFVILGDTGEGDYSQHGLVPLLRALKPDWMIINGDVAYPAGRAKDFERGFFRPYRNLGIPIWAVPGNHEYYSRDKGRTFFQTFCTYRFADRWRVNNLPLVPQPGTYWEVKEPNRQHPLVVIGLDTGMKGNLDGIGRGKNEDRAQHGWLRDRLERAESEGRSVIVFFHIPSLVDERHDEVHLSELHRILAASQVVRLVICGHIHNHQYYPPAMFRKYLQKAQRTVPAATRDRPHYVVTGGGGAYTSEPRETGDYKANFFFPTKDQWREHAHWAEKLVSASGLRKSGMARIAGSFGAAAQGADADSAKFLSLVLVDVDQQRVEARHILLPDLRGLYALPAGTAVRVDDPNPAIDPAHLRSLLNAKAPIQIVP